MHLFDLWEAHPATMVMYHGTNASSAKRIATEGFAANPPQDYRQYSTSGEDDPYLASLDGAYFTDMLPVAVGYAWKSAVAFSDWSALVVAKVALADAVPDEDVIDLALQDAVRIARDSNDFVRAFHHNLVQNRPIPMHDALLLQLRDAYQAFEHGGDSDDEFDERGQHYRHLLDQVAHAYAAMVFDTHPTYLGGAHTVRLPNGLPPQQIISITVFDIRFRHDDARFPFVTEVSSLYGKPLNKTQLHAAVNTLKQRAFFG